jgi:hydrogenase expression/formation protein HypC
MRVVEVLEMSRAVVEAEGLSKQVDVSLLDEITIGDYVIVHAGFAIEKLDPREADARLELFAEMARLEEADRGGRG